MFIGIVWLVVSALFTADEQAVAEPSEMINYIEKINQFVLQGFNEKQQLVHFVEADKYYNFKDEPALLLNPKVITYDVKGEEVYTLSSKRAHYLDDGRVQFNGKVNINSKSGVVYQINAKELSVNTKTNDLMSDKQIVYLDKTAKVIAQGMRTKAAEDKMYLTGKTTINQDRGQTIVTRDLLIDQTQSKKRYYSKHKTSYLASGNKIDAQGLDMDMNKDIAILLGKVKILQKSGAKIETKRLVIDQSQGRDIYRTKEKVHYQFNMSDIRAKKGMRYDAQDQKIRLTGGVVGRYE
ncbi:hypothetical protein MNB_SUP05-SYMBIONT-5-1293 [hydrothermal vent metagenome]|uniref:Organic solvent tolerance-like N-terminal domain-containing protein n=1 Tax=hydrothermal vent metagenome TaxID=652676 RepID=A0A1W1E568_9ZZZZ